MAKLLVKFGASAVTAICAVVGLFCPWGFIASGEAGQEAWAWRATYATVFVAAILLGTLSYRVASKL